MWLKLSLFYLAHLLLLVWPLSTSALSMQDPPFADDHDYPQITYITLCGELKAGFGNVGKTKFSGSVDDFESYPPLMEIFMKARDEINNVAGFVQEVKIEEYLNIDCKHISKTE